LTNLGRKDRASRRGKESHEKRARQRLVASDDLTRKRPYHTMKEPRFGEKKVRGGL